MKGMTFWEPNAHLVVIEAKRVDTRRWETDYKGLIVIRSSPQLPLFARRVIEDEMSFQAQALRQAGVTEVTLDLYRGHALGVAYLARCIPALDALPQINVVEREFGKYTRNRFALILEGVRRFKTPIPIPTNTGMISGLWDVPPSLERQVIAMLQVTK